MEWSFTKNVCLKYGLFFLDSGKIYTYIKLYPLNLLVIQEFARHDAQANILVIIFETSKFINSQVYGLRSFKKFKYCKISEKKILFSWKNFRFKGSILKPRQSILGSLSVLRSKVRKKTDASEWNMKIQTTLGQTDCIWDTLSSWRSQKLSSSWTSLRSF